MIVYFAKSLKSLAFKDLEYSLHTLFKFSCRQFEKKTSLPCLQKPMTTINADKKGKAEQTPTAKHKSKINIQMPNITFDPIFNSKEEKYLRAQSKATFQK